MKKIGLIGGLSWQSSVEYYRIINEVSNNRLGDKATVESIMYSTDLQRKFDLVTSGDLDTLAEEFIDITKSLERAGADVVVMCTNTMHLVFDKVAESVDVPMIHIVDATGEAIRKAGIKKVALLGTTFTMTDPFIMGRLKEKYDVDCLVPTEEEKPEIMRVIEEELTYNILKESSREYYVNVIKELARQGAEGVILGCTEIPLLIKQKDSPIPVFDTTELHALAALDYAMAD
ncbi:MAG: aspartate/glutamate racemase family protein [Oscillospiraceae bacterium]|nr:aspartate/glutamate racemase family protein [Oscillospiraceae bacterium]